MGTIGYCAALCWKRFAVSYWILSKFPYGNLGCCAAPVWG
jgi:hypothetical protein